MSPIAVVNGNSSGKFRRRTSVRLIPSSSARMSIIRSMA